MYAWRENFTLNCSNLFSLKDYKKITKWYIITLKINMVEEPRFEFRLRKIDATRNDFLDEIKPNDLIREKY